jgi:hypothetical protein
LHVQASDERHEQLLVRLQGLWGERGKA